MLQTNCYNRMLRPNVSCVERSRHRRILRALYNRAPVRKYRHLMRRHAKAQQEFIVSDVRYASTKTLPQRRQIQLPAMLVNLYRIPPAHGYPSLSLPSQIREVAAHARAALRITFHRNRLESATPQFA